MISVKLFISINNAHYKVNILTGFEPWLSWSEANVLPTVPQPIANQNASRLRWAVVQGSTPYKDDF